MAAEQNSRSLISQLFKKPAHNTPHRARRRKSYRRSGYTCPSSRESRSSRMSQSGVRQLPFHTTKPAALCSLYVHSSRSCKRSAPDTAIQDVKAIWRLFSKIPCQVINNCNEGISLVITLFSSVFSGKFFSVNYNNIYNDLCFEKKNELDELQDQLEKLKKEK